MLHAHYWPEPLGGRAAFRRGVKDLTRLFLVSAIAPQDPSDPGAMEELMGSLGKDADGELTFPEFWQLMGKLASRQGGFS